MVDDLLVLKVAGAADVTESTDAGTLATIDPAALVVDLGPGTVHAKVILDITSMDIVSNDEHYEFVVLGCVEAGTATKVLASLRLGATEVSPVGDAVVGRYEIPFCNNVQGTIYPKVTIGLIMLGTTASVVWGARISH
jgi:hypothetical protein